MADYTNPIPAGNVPSTSAVVRNADYGREYYGEQAFWKMQTGFLDALFGFTRQENLALITVLKNIHPRTNTYDGTIKGLARRADVDEKTVRSALLKMQEKNILAPVAPGQWMLNPRLLAKGSFLQEVKLMATYDTCQGKKVHGATVIDDKTGELVTLPNEYATVEQFYEAQAAERFIKLYKEFFTGIVGLSETELKILVYILQAMDLGKNMYIGTMEKIKAHCGCSTATVSRAMTQFVNRNLMVKEFDGCWRINPGMIITGHPRKVKALENAYAATKEINEKRPRSGSRKRRRTPRLHNLPHLTHLATVLASVPYSWAI